MSGRRGSCQILFASAERSLARLARTHLDPAHYRCDEAPSAKMALEKLTRGTFDLAVVDVRLVDESGTGLWTRVRSQFPALLIVLVADRRHFADALEGLRAGAFQYLRTPVSEDELRLVIDQANEERSRRESGQFAELKTLDRFRKLGFVGRSRSMQTLYDLVERVAPFDTTVLIHGESGTGKELVARALHGLSPRPASRFVAINCGAIPRELMESELFGHREGAFSGASAEKRGLIEEGDGGTVFLDEISELDPALQVKLTRVLQERELRRVGDTVDRKLDVRFLAATNRDLGAMVEEGQFREDLFFRLQVFPISVPPLRERQGDLTPLTEHLMRRFSRKLGKRLEGIDDEARAILAAHHWPGNVRELVNTIERAVLLERGDVLSAASFPGLSDTEPGASASMPDETLPYRDFMDEATARAQKHFLKRALERCMGNVSEAARMVGVQRETLHRLIRKAGLDATDFRARRRRRRKP